MNRLYFVCRQCLAAPGISFEHATIEVAYQLDAGWFPLQAKTGNAPLDLFFFQHGEHSGGLPGHLHFALMDERSMEPEAHANPNTATFGFACRRNFMGLPRKKRMEHKKTAFCRLCGGRLRSATFYLLAVCSKCKK